MIYSKIKNISWKIEFFMPVFTIECETCADIEDLMLNPENIQVKIMESNTENHFTFAATNLFFKKEKTLIIEVIFDLESGKQIGHAAQYYPIIKDLKDEVEFLNPHFLSARFFYPEELMENYCFSK